MNSSITKHQTKLKFVIVGIWNAVFGYLTFVILDIIFTYLFSKRYFAYMTAAVLSNILAILNAFISHKYITFKSSVGGRKIILEFIRFFSTYLISFLLGLILLPLLVEIFHIDPKISAAIMFPVTAIISYVGHSYFSFKTINSK